MKVERTTPIEELPELLRVEEFAAWADVSKGVIYEAIRSGEIQAVRFGRLVRIPRAALAAMVKR